MLKAQERLALASTAFTFIFPQMAQRPPSARLCENYEDKGSDYAAEGTAHSLCEYKLKKPWA